MKFHIVINPVAASGAAGKLFQQMEPLFAGVDYVVHRSTKEEGIREIVQKLTRDVEEDVSLVVIGGDGTMNEVVNGIEDFSHTRIGLIPCGSGNDMVRDMQLPKKREELVQRILEGKVVHETNVCQTTFLPDGTTQKFLVSSGMGFDAEVCHEVSISEMKHILNRLHMGSLVYLLVAFKVLLRKTRFVLQTPNGTFAQTMFVSAHNHQYEGGGFRFAPDAQFDDGILSLCIVHDVTIPKFLRLFQLAYDGSHVAYKQHITLEEGKSIVLKANRPVWIHTDGETSQKAKAIRVEVLEEKLKFLI